MSFTTSYNSTDASNTYISSTYGNVAINAVDSTNSIYLGCTDCSSNVNNNLGNTVNDVYMGGNLTVDSSLNVGGYTTIAEDLTVDGSLNVGGNLNIDGSLNISGFTTFGGGTPFMKIQYGYSTASTYTNLYSTYTGKVFSTSVSFTTNFNNAPSCVLATANGVYLGNTCPMPYIVSVNSVTTAGFTAYCAAPPNDTVSGATNVPTSVSFWWLAIGY